MSEPRPSASIRPTPPASYRWLVLLVVALAMFANYSVFDAMNPVGPLLEAQLGFTQSQIGLLDSAYNVAALLVLLLGGVLIDRAGTKRAMVLFSIVTACGGVLIALGSRHEQMMAGRFVLGLGAEPLIVAINPQQAVLGGKWSRQQKPAEYLPSSREACLQTNASEVTCFSEDITRNVADKGLTYTVKATLSGLDGRDGRFNLHYVYNVADVNGSTFGQPNSALADANDLAARTGWQEPGVKMECRLSDERSMTCTRADRKGSYQYSRD